MKINLTQERLNRGLSLNSMATELDISPNTLKRAEAGQGIHPATALKIADFLGYCVTDIWPLEPDLAEAA